MTIGERIAFNAVFEGDESCTVPSVGTVSDIRDGHAFAFVLGYRWPFTVRLDDESQRGYYPLTAEVQT